MAKIDPTARIGDQVSLDEQVEIGPYCCLEGKIRVGRGTRLLSHVVIRGKTHLGENNIIYGPCALGFPPQDLKYQGEETELRIGNHNIIREFTTFNTGTIGGGGVTRIGNHNFFMAYTHIAHDCQVGNHTVFANNATLAGHVVVGDHAIIGAFSAIHQFCRVGTYAFLGGFTVVTQDALPFCKTVGSRPAKVYGINTLGLERKGFSSEDIQALQKAFRLLFLKKLPLTEALKKVEEALGKNPRVSHLIDFIKNSQRGIIGR